MRISPATRIRGTAGRRRPRASRVGSRWILGPASLVLSGAVAACAGGSGEPAVPIPDLSFAPELGVDLDQMVLSPSGLYLQDLEVGRGEEARSNRSVTVHYVGWFPDGQAFESSLGSGEPVTFTLGRREVIRGWEEGVRGMREGGQRRLVIPSRLAYGRRGLDDLVPPNAVLVFQIQLLAVER